MTLSLPKTPCSRCCRPISQVATRKRRHGLPRSKEALRKRRGGSNGQVFLWPTRTGNATMPTTSSQWKCSKIPSALPCGTSRRFLSRCMCHLTRTVQCGPRHGSPTAIVSARQVCSVALSMHTYKPYGYMHSNLVGWKFYMVWGPTISHSLCFSKPQPRLNSSWDSEYTGRGSGARGSH